MSQKSSKRKPEKFTTPKPEGWMPKGCDDEELYNYIKSDTCPCSCKKTTFTSFCRACYFNIPFELRQDLWRPWTDGFAKVYAACIDYLEQETQRFTCPKGTSSPATSTSSSDSVKKKPTGTHFQRTLSVTHQRLLSRATSLLSDSPSGPTTTTSSDSAKDSTKSSTSQGTTSTTGRTPRVLKGEWPF